MYCFISPVREGRKHLTYLRNYYGSGYTKVFFSIYAGRMMVVGEIVVIVITV